MHEPVKNFSLQGTMGERNHEQTYSTLLKECYDWMRDESYAPLDDIIPQFTRDYNPTTELYDFQLTVYGALVEEDAWQISGIADGKTIARSTQKTK